MFGLVLLLLLLPKNFVVDDTDDATSHIQLDGSHGGAGMRCRQGGSAVGRRRAGGTFQWYMCIAMCHNCGKLHHLAKVCKSKKSTGAAANQVRFEDSDSDEGQAVSSVFVSRPDIMTANQVRLVGDDSGPDDVFDEVFPVNIVDVQMNGRTSSAEFLRSVDSVFGKLVGNHDDGIAKLQLRMTDAATGFAQSKLFNRVERGLVVFDRRVGVAQEDPPDREEAEEPQHDQAAAAPD